MENFMKKALFLAKKAYDSGEIPVGAIIVNEKMEIIGEGFNQTIIKKDITYHAEIIAIREAYQKVEKNLDRCSIWVTLEPCLMCLGAISEAKIPHLYYGASNDKNGFSYINSSLIKECFSFSNKIFSGILKDECSLILKKFFNKLRISKK